MSPWCLQVAVGIDEKFNSQHSAVLECVKILVKNERMFDTWESKLTQVLSALHSVKSDKSNSVKT